MLEILVSSKDRNLARRKLLIVVKQFNQVDLQAAVNQKSFGYIPLFKLVQNSFWNIVWKGKCKLRSGIKLTFHMYFTSEF